MTTTPAWSLTGGYGQPDLNSDGSLSVPQVSQLLGLILIELRVLNAQICEMNGSEEELDQYRSDAYYAAPTNLTNPY